MLDKFDILLIRTCKSGNPTIKKLRNILAMRNGINPEDVQNMYLAYVLLDIVMDYDLINGRINNFIVTKCHPEEQKYMRGLGLDNSHISNIIRACYSTIRLSKIDKFPNFISPLKFRNVRITGVPL